MSSKEKIDKLVTSLEEIQENCLDNSDNVEFHKEALQNASTALNGYVGLQDASMSLGEQGVLVEGEVAEGLLKIAESSINKDPTSELSLESFAREETSQFNDAVQTRIEQLGIFVLDKMDSLKENFNEDEIAKICNFSERALKVLSDMRNLLI